MSSKAIPVALTIILLAVLGMLVAGSRGSSLQIEKIGLVFPITGDAAVYGEGVRDAALLAIEHLKRDHGIEITPIIEDDQLSSPKAASAAKKMLENDGVVAIVTFTSGETLSICPITRAAGSVLLTTGSAPAISECGGNTFRNYPPDTYQAKVLAERVRAAGYKRVALAYINNDYGVGLKSEFLKNHKDVVATEAFAVSEKDFRTLIAKVKAVTPDVLVLPSYPVEATNIVEQMQTLGLRIPIIGSESTKDDSVARQLSPVAAQLFSAVAVADYGGPEAKAYRMSHLERFGKSPGTFSEYVYDNVTVLGLALESCKGRADSERSSCVANYLRNVDMVGATGKISFDAHGDREAMPYGLFVIENGTFVPKR